MRFSLATARSSPVIACALVAAFGAAVLVPTQADAQSHVIRLSHGMPENMDSGQHAWAVVFKDYVEEKTGGDVEVRILGNNAAGAERQQLEKVQTGINQMLLVSEITMPSFYEPALVWGIPFLFDSSVVAFEVLDGPFMDRFSEAWLDATGVRMVGAIESGFRSMFNSVRQIGSPEDMVGLKMRTGENPVHIAMMEALGANPTPIAWTEVYTSLQQGVVDGMENPPGLFHQMRFHEQQDHLTVDKHLYSIHFAMINEDFFQSLPEEYQGHVMAGAGLADTIGRAVAYLAEQRAIETLQEEGIEVYYPTPEEYQQFRDLGRPPAEQLVREEIGDEWVDEILATVEQAREEVTNLRYTGTDE